MVHLQGWGEPLLHKHFFEMVARAKKAGCRIGTTTNGMLLDCKEITRLVESGIDHIAFSLTGIGKENDKVRRGTDFRRILQVISALAAKKKSLNVETPNVNIAYLLLRSHLANIDELVPMLEGLELKQVIISTLDFVPSKELQDEVLMPRDEREYRQLKSLLDRLVLKGKRAGLDIHYHLVSPGKRKGICTENPRRALVVSADGTVLPCVFMNIPVFGALQEVGGHEQLCQRLTFGNVTDESIPTIWRSRKYIDFRDSFDTTPSYLCRECPKLYEV
jgi:MoaA/NifB/PqqE/SkfB family radical SAM enzyme